MKIQTIEATITLDSGLQVRLSGEYEPIREFLDKISKDEPEIVATPPTVTPTASFERQGHRGWHVGAEVEATKDYAGGFCDISVGDTGVISLINAEGVWAFIGANGDECYFTNQEVAREEIRLT